MLALALILQAYMGISDDEVIEATVMDRRWQLVLDCLDTEQAPWSQRDPGGLPKASHRGSHGSTAHRTNHRDCQPERSEEHTSELQSHSDLVCRLLLEKKKKKRRTA